MLYTDKEGKRRIFTGIQAYKINGQQEWMLVNTADSWIDGHGIVAYGCYAMAYGTSSASEVPAMGHTNTNAAYLFSEAHAVSMAKMPKAWQDHFNTYLQEARERSNNG